MLPRLGGGGGGSGNFTHRVPRAWAPEHEQRYSFRAWAQDLHVWLMMIDLQPAEQAAAVVVCLGSSARELVRSITPDETVES